MAKIFETNAYQKEIVTKITKIDKENKTIELEDTIFYGQSGGQPGDTGQIIIDGQKIEVKKVDKKKADTKKEAEKSKKEEKKAATA